MSTAASSEDLPQGLVVVDFAGRLAALQGKPHQLTIDISDTRDHRKDAAVLFACGSDRF
jgi:hypothetical protein